ncbi:hypothetical protein C7M84_001317 [Penaeus vannamei]|uniref:Peptidase S1 domain-containing protein n=1 Tax=Penaeus vannamei TaxID=6689 RepID=A0A423TU36_PENVA|nr:hypothetical protein C7M84_001317 [Penaeus vannamei]
MGRHSLVGVILALVLASVLAAATPCPIQYGLLDNLEESENLLKISKRHAEIHHVAKREAKMHAVSKRQASDTSRLEALQLRTALMFIEADQAADITVALALAEVFNKINSTLQAGRGGNPDAFERQLQGIAANVSANSVLPKDCGRRGHPLTPLALTARFPPPEPLRQRDPLRGSHPWVVSVGYKNGDKDTIGCVAVVISRHHVITHAICAATTKYDHVLLKNTAYKVSNRWFHPSLKSDDDVTNGHNIGIVMTEKLVFNDEVQPACLPGINDVVSAVGDGTTTLVGFEASPRGGVTKYLLGPTPRPSIPCSASKPSEPSELEAARVGIRSTRSSTDTHAELSVTVDQDPSTGRVEVTGVGPVTDPSSNYPMAFTLIQTHTFWLELMVKNSIRLCSEHK